MQYSDNYQFVSVKRKLNWFETVFCALNGAEYALSELYLIQNLIYLNISSLFDSINKLELEENLVAPNMDTGNCTDNYIN